MPDPRPHLSLVIPAYRERARVEATLAELADFGQAYDRSTEVLFVDDGSDDGTLSFLESAANAWPEDAGRLHVLCHGQNKGKGAAVRTGVLAAKGDYVIFTDADLAYGTEPFPNIVSILEDGADVVAGRRDQRWGVARRLAGRAFATLVRIRGLTQAGDPQCGLKGFRADAAKLLFGLSVIDDFAFDVEVLYLAGLCDLDVREVAVRMRMPTRVGGAGHSTVRLISDVPRMVASIGEIKRAAGAGRYEIPAPSS